MSAAMTGGRQRLFQLLKRQPGQDIDFEDFCREYEKFFNFGLREGELSPEEERACKALFEIVAWFTPLAHERQELPSHFRDESAVTEALSKIRKIFGISIGD